MKRKSKKLKFNPYLNKQAEEIIQLPLIFIAQGGSAETYKFVLSKVTIVDGKKLPQGEYVVKYYFNNFKILNDSTIEYFKILSDKKLIPKIWIINENYIIMDFVEGKTIRQLINEHIKPGLWERIFFKIAKEIDHWHLEKESHGDLNASNVIVTPEGRIVFIDPSFNKGQFEKDLLFIGYLEDLIEIAETEF